MVAGQVLDTICHVKDEAGLALLNRLKTGAMISAAAELGCVASKMPMYWRQQAVLFAEQLGLAFQITDDLLDVTGDATFGKPIGSDAKNGKVTALTFLTAEEAEEAAREATEAAIQAVGPLPDSEILCRLAGFLLERRR